jgi:hypothetical protein
MSNDKVQSYVTYGGPSYFDMDDAFCGRMRAAIARGLESAPIGVIIKPMTAEQAATLKRLAEAAYDLAAFKPNLTHDEANERIAILTAKLKLLDGPPHTL